MNNKASKREASWGEVRCRGVRQSMAAYACTVGWAVKSLELGRWEGPERAHLLVADAPAALLVVVSLQAPRATAGAVLKARLGGKREAAAVEAQQGWTARERALGAGSVLPEQI